MSNRERAALELSSIVNFIRWGAGLEINRIVTPRDVLTAYDVGEIIQYAGMLFLQESCLL